MTIAMQASRRGLFKKLIAPETLHQPELFALRPPGALPESLFIDQCQRCDKCVAACPEQVIVRGDGGFPELSFDARGCSGCGDCQQACPTTALSTGARWPLGDISLKDACFTLKGIACQSCKDACDVEAIQFPMTSAIAQPVLNTELCTACGECVAICPADGLEIKVLSTGESNE